MVTRAVALNIKVQFDVAVSVDEVVDIRVTFQVFLGVEHQEFFCLHPYSRAPCRPHVSDGYVLPNSVPSSILQRGCMAEKKGLQEFAVKHGAQKFELLCRGRPNHRRGQGELLPYISVVSGSRGA